MADTTCTSHWAASQHRNCLRAMAAGWITSEDLCPHCTTRFVAALDAVEEMPWHADFIEKGTSDGHA